MDRTATPHVSVMVWLRSAFDVSRKFHPNRLKSYTVWNMKTNARPRNHGSRVDFILAASGQRAPASGGSSRDTPDKVQPTHSSLLLKCPPAQQLTEVFRVCNP